MFDFLSAAGLTIPELENVRLVKTEIMLTPTDFDPVSIDDQGRLDRLEPKMITCPHCGKDFDAREA
jgi:hypothetical protein